MLVDVRLKMLHYHFSLSICVGYTHPKELLMIRSALRRGVFFASLVASSFFISSNVIAKPDVNQKMIDQTIDAFMQKNQIPGAAVAVINHGQSHIYVFGVADKSSNKPVTSETVFAIGSITKLFTTLLFSQEIAQNQLKMSDKLTKYIQPLDSNKNLNQITLEELATYTGSLPFKAPDSVKTEMQVQNYLTTWEPEKPIGSVFQYSNVSIGLLGKVLQIQNQDYIQALYQHAIFTPLKMTSTTVTLTPEMKKTMAQGYTVEGVPVEPASTSLFPSAAAGKSTIHDLSRFLAAAIGLPDTPKNIHEAMMIAQTPRATMGNVSQAFSWQLMALSDPQLLKAPENMDMGPTSVKWLPKTRQHYNSDMLIDKTGATEGFRAYVAVIPGEQSGIVILTNRYVSNGEIVNVGRKILVDLKSPSA